MSTARVIDNLEVDGLRDEDVLKGRERGKRGGKALVVGWAGEEVRRLVIAGGPLRRDVH